MYSGTIEDAEAAINYVAPVGKKDESVARAVDTACQFLPNCRCASNI